MRICFDLEKSNRLFWGSFKFLGRMQLKKKRKNLIKGYYPCLLLETAICGNFPLIVCVSRRFSFENDNHLRFHIVFFFTETRYQMLGNKNL